jgi:serine/threonine-protein kinase HipA
MERELLVYVDLAGSPVLAGRLWARARGAKESASFEYDVGWLGRRDAFGLDPELPPSRGQFHTSRPLFNAFTDPAPDRWGQTLMRRNERARARQEKRQPRTLLTLDFLALVDDETRLGALRFKDAGGDAYLSATGKRLPPVLELPRLLSATGRIIDQRETDDDLLLVLGPGSSLGGARPKASVRDKDGRLLVAKFPRKDDEWSVTRWEATALALAKRAGIEVPAWRLEAVLKKPVLMLRRFDRRATERIPFMSALTAVQGEDNEARSYLDIVDAIRRGGSQVDADLRQLWRRVVFNVLVSNTDDHLRNHGLLRDAVGWRLAPAYDLNPMPIDVRPRVHALAIDESDTTASLETALGVAPAFGIAKVAEARSIAKEVGTAVARWRTVADAQGIGRAEIERMASAFEHEDLESALGRVKTRRGIGGTAETVTKKRRSSRS